VLVTARIAIANVLPGGVNVQRVAPNGTVTVVGALNDAGVDGDARAGDGVYSGHVTLAESVEGRIGLRVSVAVRGVLRRLISPSAMLAVVPAGAPTALLVPDTSQQTVDLVSGEAVLANSLNACFTDATPYTTVAALAATVGGSPTGRFPAIGNCYQITIAPGDGTAIASAVAALGAHPEVRFAEPEPVLRSFDACTGPICGDVNYATVLNLAQAHVLGTGNGIRIGILDTGLDASIIPGASFANTVIGSNFSNSGNPAVPRDDNGHGTLVAHIALSTAPDSSLFITKVADANGHGADRSVILGAEEAVANGAGILNLSFGSRLQTFVMRDYLTQVHNRGLLTVAAAGNENSSIRTYPAAHVGVVAVGNIDSSDKRFTGAKGSNFGPWVNIAAPGVNIAGFGGGGTGTSFSAPFVAGAAALVAAKFPTMTRADVAAHLYRTAMPIPELATKDTCPAQPCNQDLGSGRLDVEAALGAIRLTRVTSVTASGAGIVRTIEVAVSSAPTNTTLYSSTRSFLGQANQCEVATAKNPPCISNVPFDFAALPSGTYLLRLSFRDPSASFFGSVQLTTPGAFFTAVRSGGGSITPGDATRADFSLFGFSTTTAILEITKY
jgi:hypothetical protein